jgi:hypothetical protein
MTVAAKGMMLMMVVEGVEVEVVVLGGMDHTAANSLKAKGNVMCVIT